MKKYSIVGMDHRKSEAFVAALQSGVAVTLIREPNNPFDPLAVAVWIEGRHVGYIPKKQNQALAIFIDRSGDTSLAMDAMPPGSPGVLIERAIPAKFVRSPNSGFPMVEVSE